MNHSVSVRKFFEVLLLPLVLLLAGCTCLSPDIVNVSLPSNMTPFNDAAKKLHFQLPPGWKQASVDPVIEKNTRGIRWAEPAGFRKGDKGMFAVWCDSYNPNRSAALHKYDVVDAYAPVHELYTCFEVESPGSGYLSRPNVCTAPATHVVKGEKKQFLIISAVKTPTVTKMHKECEYVLVGASSSSEYNDEIKADITAVAATLNNSGEYK